MINDDYRNQKVMWKKKLGDGAYGPIFDEPKTIYVRWEGKRRLVRNNQGEEVVSEARVFCGDNVGTGDVMIKGEDDWVVLSVSEIPDFDGNITEREAAV
jgi:hypothetical protein